MKKITKLMAMLLTIVLVFTGCGTMNIKMTVNQDGTYSSAITLELDKNEYDKLVLANNPEVTSEDQVLGLLQEYYAEDTLGTGQVPTVEVITKDDGKQYYSIKTATEKYEVDSAYTYFGGMMGMYDFYFSKDTVYMTFNGQDIIAYAKLLEMDQIEGLDINSLKLTMEIEFPENIVANEGGVIDPANPKCISYDISMTEMTKMFATTNASVKINEIEDDIAIAKDVKKTKIQSLDVKSIKNKKAKVSLKVKKVKDAYGYEVQYSTNRKFKGKTTKTVEKYKRKMTLKNLKVGKKYYFRVRAIKMVGMGLVYSKYSPKKSLKIKK